MTINTNKQIVAHIQTLSRRFCFTQTACSCHCIRPVKQNGNFE